MMWLQLGPQERSCAPRQIQFFFSFFFNRNRIPELSRRRRLRLLKLLCMSDCQRSTHSLPNLKQAHPARSVSPIFYRCLGGRRAHSPHACRRARSGQRHARVRGCKQKTSPAPLFLSSVSLRQKLMSSSDPSPKILARSVRWKQVGFVRIRIRISRITIFVFSSNFHLLGWKRIGFARIRIRLSRIFSDIHFSVSLPFPSLLSTVSTYSTSRVFL